MYTNQGLYIVKKILFLKKHLRKKLQKNCNLYLKLCYTYKSFEIDCQVDKKIGLEIIKTF